MQCGACRAPSSTALQIFWRTIQTSPVTDSTMKWLRGRYLFFFLVNAVGGRHADAPPSPWLPSTTQRNGTTTAWPFPVTQAVMEY